jgi:ethanolamine ammonia-lyase large subunit
VAPHQRRGRVHRTRGLQNQGAAGALLPEDIAIGKLHGLTIGLDICSTLHMAVSLEDLDWCQDQIMPAGPAYLIAFPPRTIRC